MEESSSSARPRGFTKRFVSFFLACLPFIGCSGPVIGNGKVETEVRALPSFRSVSFSGSGEMRVHHGAQKVAVTADSNILPYLETKVSGDRLSIGLKPGTVILSPSKLIVEVTLPELESVTMSGSGNALVDPFEGDELALTISGSGSVEAALDYRRAAMKLSGSGSCEISGSVDEANYDISGSGSVEAALRCERIAVKVSGSGPCRLSGSADEASYEVSGSGSIRARDFATKRTELRIGGSGDAEIRASDRLELVVSGSGSVRYYGSPELTQRLSGSGSIRKVGD